MSNQKIKFALTFPENLKRNANLSNISPLAYDDLGDFIEERLKLQRTVESSLDTDLKVDYSDFANHVFFDSALSKFNISKKRILEKYPYNGTSEEKDAFELTGSGYDHYLLNEWPRYVGYVFLNGTNQFLSASDTDNKLRIGSSSFYVSSWINPVITNQNLILQVLSASASPAVLKHGYELYLSGATDPHIKFTLYSGSQKVSVSSSYVSFTSSFNNVSVLYDSAGDLLSLYINDTIKSSASVSYGSIDFASTKIFVGSGSQYTSVSSSFDYYSGSLDEIRILLTSSDLYHIRNYNRPIDSEQYVALNYRFNEGITGTGSIDAVVVDYSKNGLHGVLLNYDSACRVSGTSMQKDPGDVILYSFHPSVVSFTSSIELSATFYDNENNNLIFNLLPSGLLEEDSQQENIMQHMSLAMARFFDEIKLYIDQFINLKVTNYDDINETPDLFLPTLIKYFGWKVTDHFGDSNPLSFFFGDKVISNTGSLDVSLMDIRNQFWRRLLNNLPYLLKTKGKRNNLDSFLNVLGINQENINIKEYGYLPGGSIQDTRIGKNKVTPLLGIGTGSLSSSFVKVPLLINETHNTYTVETFAQFPYASASYSGTLSVLTGSIWQFVDPEQVTGSFGLFWNVPSLGSTTGKFILSSSDGLQFSSSVVEVFDGDFVYVAAGLDSAQKPFIELRTIDNDVIDFSGTYAGASALAGLFTASKLDFIMGATSGTFFQKNTQGYYGEYRVWSRQLSASEITNHAYHFENVGINDPTELPHPLVGHWALNENKSTNTAGDLVGIIDYSRKNQVATGSQFLENHNPYKKFDIEYSYLSPSLDLKWTENKIRIRDKTKLYLKDIAVDSNEISLEFNLVDALNRDISKIFSSFDVLNNAIGNPINKYRDEYADLEAYRRLYFDRLGDSIHFTAFFKLFKWFDRKISDSIKQLLPARTKFIGGEQVVESHFLERPRYAYKYPIFRTPVDIPNADLSGVLKTDGLALGSYSVNRSFLGTTANTEKEKQTKYTVSGVFVQPSDSCIVPDVSLLTKDIVSTFNDGNENSDRISGFFKLKVSGDTQDTINNSNSSVNFKNEYTKKTLTNLQRDNFDGNHSGTLVNRKLGNAFVVNDTRSILDNEHYFGAAKKHVRLQIKALADKSIDSNTVSYYHLDEDSGYVISAGGFNVVDSSFNKAHASGSSIFQGKNGYVKYGTDINSASLGFINLSSSLKLINPSSNRLVSGTIEFWFKANNASDWTAFKNLNFVTIDSDSASPGFNNKIEISQQSGTLVFLAKTSGSIARVTSSAYNGNTDWHHYAMTFNSSSGLFYSYVDGQVQGSGSFGDWLITYPASFFRFGSSGSLSCSFSGTYDEIRISNIVRDIPNTWKTYGGEQINYISGSLFAITASNGLELKQRLFDCNNYYFNTASFAVGSIFGLSSGSQDIKFEPILDFYVSCSNGAFSTANISVEFKDDCSNAWSSYKNIIPISMVSDPDSNGWYHLLFNFISGSVTNPVVIFDENRLCFRISSSQNTYVFRDINLSFNQTLTNDGVKFYQDIDNQSNKKIFNFINRTSFKKVE